jgi:hypothetical protein
MVHLVLTFCLLAAQAQCTEERPLLEEMSLAGCAARGQQVAKEWLDAHPKWMLRGWRCERNIPRQLPS